MNECIEINEKVITWVRRTLQVSNVNSAEEAINKVILSYESTDPYYNDEDIELLDSEEVRECEEPLFPEDNGGEATLEIAYNGEVYWDNSGYNSLRQ